MVSFNTALKRKLLFNRKRDISILRQVLYKELMANKRAFSKTIPSLALTPEDKKAIDGNLAWFMADDIETVDDKLVQALARTVLTDIQEEQKRPNNTVTAAQDNFAKELQEALTLKGDEKSF